MKNPLLPQSHHVLSRRWNFLVNSLAASPMLGPDVRKQIYRRLGMDISPDAYEIGARCYFHSDQIRIGANTRINDRCFFENTAHLEIGSGVGIGVQCTFISSTHNLGDSSSRSSGGWRYLPVTLQDGCWIGARSTILAGVTVGSGCVVAAGAVVTSDCAPDGLYGGVPARRLRDLDIPSVDSGAHENGAGSPTAKTPDAL